MLAEMARELLLELRQERVQPHVGVAQVADRRAHARERGRAAQDDAARHHRHHLA